MACAKQHRFLAYTHLKVISLGSAKAMHIHFAGSAMHCSTHRSTTCAEMVQSTLALERVRAHCARRLRFCRGRVGY
jgi:hypothetical protein